MVDTEERLIREITRVTSITGIDYIVLRNMGFLEYETVRAEAVKIVESGRK